MGATGPEECNGRKEPDADYILTAAQSWKTEHCDGLLTAWQILPPL